MKDYDLTDSDLKLIRDDGLAVKMSVEEAREFFDKQPDEAKYQPWSDALNNAQGAVFSESAGRAFVIVVIDP